MAGGTLLSLWAKSTAKSDDKPAADRPKKAKLQSATPSQDTTKLTQANAAHPEENKAPDPPSAPEVTVIDEDMPCPPAVNATASETASPGSSKPINCGSNAGSSASKVALSPFPGKPNPEQESSSPAALQQKEDGPGRPELAVSDAKQLDLKSPGRAQTAAPAVAASSQEALQGETPAGTLEALKQEMDSLQKELQGLRPLTDPAAPAIGPLDGDLSKAQIAVMVQGSPLALSELSKAICKHAKGANQTGVHNAIIGMGARTSFAAPDGRTSTLDALEDSSPDLIWRWTLRDVRLVPKEKRKEASSLAKRLQNGMQRLTALQEACSLLKALDTTQLPTKGKLPKLLARLDKLRASAREDGATAKTLATPAKAQFAPPSEKHETVQPQPEAEPAEELGQGEVLQGESSAQKKSKEDRLAEKQRLKEEKEAAAKKAKDEKEEERKRLKEEKEAAARKAKEEKLAAAEEQRCKRKAEEKAEKENKKAARSGFASTKALSAAQNTFMNFLAKAAPKAPAAGVDSGPSNAEAGSQVKSFYHQLFVPCPAAQQQHRPLPVFGAEEMEALERQLQPGAVGAEALQAQQADWKAQWRKQRGQQRQRQVGVPPSWARKADGQPQIFPEGVDLKSLVTYRRKLIQKNTAAPRPAYYGSWSATSEKISGRRPFVRDGSLELDYDLESELDWDPEEEEQGESLSDADEPEVEGEEGSDVDEDGGFCVPDGYLSDDEGGANVMDDEDDTEEDRSEMPGQPSGATGLAQELSRLQAQLEKAKRGHKCLIVTRQGCSAEEIPLQLQALRMQVLCPNKTITVPLKLAPVADGSSTCSKGQKSAETGTKAQARGSTAAIFPESHVKSLLQFLADSPKLRVNQATEAFVQLNPSEGLAKTAVKGKILAVAERSTELKCWVIRQELIVQYGVVVPERLAPKRKPITEKESQVAKKAKKNSEPAVPTQPAAKTPSTPNTKLEKFFTPATLPKAADHADSTVLSSQTPTKKASPSHESGSCAPVFESPAAPLPRPELEGAVIEDHPSAQFWQDLRRWLVKGGGNACQEDLTKGFAFATEHCVATALGSMPVDIFTALVKTMGSPAESPLRTHAAEAATNIAAALRHKPVQAPSGSGGPATLLAWPRVIQMQDVLTEALLSESCANALSSDDAKLRHHVSKFLAAVTQKFEDGSVSEAELAGATTMRRRLAANGRLLSGLASVVEEGVPEGLKCSAYACMALREILAEATNTPKDTADWKPDEDALAHMAVTVARAVAGADNAQHMPVTKHALWLAADMLSCEGIRAVVLGDHPAAAAGGDTASALVRGAAAALGGDQNSAKEAALQIVEHLISVEGTVRSGLRSMALGEGEGYYGPNISGLWLGLQKACKGEAPSGMQKLARAIIAMVSPEGSAS